METISVEVIAYTLGVLAFCFFMLWRLEASRK